MWTNQSPLPESKKLDSWACTSCKMALMETLKATSSPPCSELQFQQQVVMASELLEPVAAQARHGSAGRLLRHGYVDDFAKK